MRKMAVSLIFVGLCLAGWKFVFQPVFSTCLLGDELVFAATNRSGDTGGASPLLLERANDRAIYLRLCVGANDWVVGSVLAGGTTYRRLTLSGADSYGCPGSPDLPVFRRIISLPECDSVSVEIRVDSVSTISGVRVLPCASRRPDPVNPGEFLDLFEEDESIYGSTKIFPEVTVKLTCAGYMRAQRLTVVEIFPMQFNPAAEMLRVTHKASVVLTIHGARGKVIRNVGPMQNLLASAALNYHETSALLSSSGLLGPNPTGASAHVRWCQGSSWEAVAGEAISCGSDYLLIVGDGLLEDAADSTLVGTLADWRSTYNGYNVAIAAVTQLDATPDTLDTPECIRALIDSVYGSESAVHMTDGRLGYVLLLGDAYDPQREVILPTYYGWSGVDTLGNTLQASDAYYYLLDDDPDADHYPDVYLGRLPVDADEEDSELSNAINTILNFEPLPASATWLERALMVSGDGILFHQTAQEYETFFRGIQSDDIPPQISVQTMHVMEYGGSGEAFSEEVIDSIQTGVWVIGLLNHGNPFYISDVNPGGCFNPVDYDFLDTTMPPIVIATACHTGDFDYYSGRENYVCPNHTTSMDACDAMSERLVVQEGGAIASLGYTRTASAYSADQVFADIFKALFTERLQTLGDVVAATRLGSVGGELPQLQTLRTLTFFGDPAVNLRWRDVPNDSVDLAIGELDIKPLTTHGYLNSNETTDVELTVHNLWKADADSVGIDVWAGGPEEPGSELLVSICFGTVPAYSSVKDTIEIAEISGGRIELYVVVNPDSTIGEPTYVNNSAKTTCYSLPYKTGFPVKLCGKPYNALTLFDVHSEPGVEILVGSNLSLVCYPADGVQPLWEFTRNTEARKNTPAVGYVYKNPSPYVIFESKPFIYIIDGQTGLAVDSVFFDNGNWFAYNFYTGVHSPQTLTLGDIRGGDASLEIIGVKDAGLRVEARSVGGDVLWSTSFTGPFSVSSLAVGDIDGGGQEELVVCQEDSLAAYRIGSSEPIWPPQKIWLPSASYNFPYPSVCLFDRNDDGTLEILAKGASQEDSQSGALYLFDSDGTRIAQYNQFASGAGYAAAVAVGDLDGNGDSEIVAVFEKSIVVLSDELTLLDTDSLSAECFGRGVLLSDVNGDGDLEIIVELYSPASHSPAARLFIVYDRSLEVLQPTYAVGGSTGRSAVGDIDGDGVSELCVASADSVLHVFEVGTGTDTRPAWPQRYNNAMLTNVLEQTVAGTHSDHVPFLNNVRVVADASFDSSLYVDPTATVHVSTTDALHVGVDTSRVEIWVNGPLNIQGNADDPVEFISWDGTQETSDPHAWFGIFVTDTAGTRAMVQHCAFRNAKTAIQTNRDMYVSGCLIEYCGVNGISIAYADSIYITNTAIRDCGDRGINLLEDSKLKITNSVITGCDYGIAAYSGGVLYADSVDIIDNDESGIWLNLGSASQTPTCYLDGCTFKHNNIGIDITGTTAETSYFVNCLIDSNVTTGIWCGISDDLVLINNAVKHSPTGVWAYASDLLIQRGNYIAYNDEGIKFQGSTSAVVESTEVALNDIGIVTQYGANPDIGHQTGGQSVGRNLIHHNSPYHIENLDTTVTVMAEMNWWRGSEPSSSKFVGSVDYTPWINGDAPDIHFEERPGQVSPFERRPDEYPVKYDLSYNYPNPFNPTTTLRYRVPTPGSNVRITVYNVAGQVVTTLVREFKTPGVYRVTWDGRSDSGNPAATGVYFVNMISEDFTDTKKIVLIK